MRNSIDKVVYSLVVLGFLSIFAISNANAQPSDPGGPIEGCDPEIEECNDPDRVPIDGGASVLIAAGVAYGLKKAYDKRKQNKEADIA